MSYNIEPFLPSILHHSEEPTVYPPNRDKNYYPYYIYYAWAKEDQAKVMLKGLRKRVRNVAKEDRGDAPLYPNYALFDKPLKKMYGEITSATRRN